MQNSSASASPQRDGPKSSPKLPNHPNSRNHPKQLPSNKRSITEKSFFQKYITITNISVVFLSVIFLLATIAVVADIYTQKAEQAQKAAQLRSIRQQIAYWEDATRRYKNFRDAYIQLASLEYQLGNMEKAKMHVGEALKIDPDSKEARGIDMLLKKQQ